MQLLKLVVQVAFRNLWLYRLKTVVIATLLGFASFISIVGLTILQDVNSSMRASIIDSIAGDLQLYSSKAKDKLAVFGSTFMGRADIGVLDDIVPIRELVLQNPRVEAFVPMGLDMGLLGRGNEMDESLDALRFALKNGDGALLKERIDQVRFQLTQLQRELEQKRKIFQDGTELDKQAHDLAEASDESFLKAVASGDESHLQFLETRIAPLSGEKQPIYLNYLGTDITEYQKNFSKFKLVEGEILPAGQRGLMLGYKAREELLKNIVARLFDRLHKRVIRLGLSLSDDAESKRLAQELSQQYTSITNYLDRHEAEKLTAELSEFGIKTDESDLIAGLRSQIKAFLTVDGSNLAARYSWFYAHIAPLIKLYEISPGETITLRSYTRSGYLKSLPLKVYGVYSFEGLEDSDLAGFTNLIDLVSFRELYGQMTAESLAELKEMRAKVGIRDLDAANAEEELFGDKQDKTLEERTLEMPPSSSIQTTLQVRPVIPDHFDISEISKGLALNAAIKIKNIGDLKRVQKELQSAFDAKGYPVQVIDWQEATGFVGQTVNVIGLVLIFALLVIFVVVLVIINNSIIVGTFNRIREIGTMRAIGAQKSFVASLFLAETAITGFFGSVIGMLLALGLLSYLGWRGIPATNDVVTFLFSGPKLYPKMHLGIILLSPLLVTLIATLASVYAARHAAHVQPAEAMQEKE